MLLVVLPVAGMRMGVSLGATPMSMLSLETTPRANLEATWTSGFVTMPKVMLWAGARDDDTDAMGSYHTKFC